MGNGTNRLRESPNVCHRCGTMLNIGYYKWELQRSLNIPSFGDKDDGPTIPKYVSSGINLCDKCLAKYLEKFEDQWRKQIFNQYGDLVSE